MVLKMHCWNLVGNKAHAHATIRLSGIWLMVYGREHADQFPDECAALV